MWWKHTQCFILWISWSSRQSGVCWRSWTDRSCTYGTVLRALSICSSAQQIPWEFRRQTITATCLPETISWISNTCAGNVDIFHLPKLKVNDVLKYADTVLFCGHFYKSARCFQIHCVYRAWLRASFCLCDPQEMLLFPPLLHISYCAELDICQSKEIWNRSCTEKWSIHFMSDDFS